jgi:hypothetical protein
LAVPDPTISAGRRTWVINENDPHSPTCPQFNR